MMKCSLGPASLTHIVGLHNGQTERGVRKRPFLEQFLTGTREFYSQVLQILISSKKCSCSDARTVFA